MGKWFFEFSFNKFTQTYSKIWWLRKRLDEERVGAEDLWFFTKGRCRGLVIINCSKLPTWLNRYMLKVAYLIEKGTCLKLLTWLKRAHAQSCLLDWKGHMLKVAYLIEKGTCSKLLTVKSPNVVIVFAQNNFFSIICECYPMFFLWGRVSKLKT
jgi:hypothetical protein